MAFREFSPVDGPAIAAELEAVRVVVHGAHHGGKPLEGCEQVSCVRLRALEQPLRNVESLRRAPRPLPTGVPPGPRGSL